MEQTKLSVLVICYNQESTIRRTLESILLQSHAYPYELIVCDDCSSDSTPQIIEGYREKYPDIVEPVIRAKNLGLIGNYYDGLSKIHGEYLMVCAGDDYWLPGKVEKQISYLDTHGDIGLVYGDAKCVDSNGNEHWSPFWGSDANTIESFLPGNHVCAPSMAIRTNLLKKYLDEVRPMARDWKMEDFPMLLWFSCNSKIEYLNGEVVGYTIQTESASHSKSIDKLRGILQSDYDVKRYFIDKYRDGKIDYDIEYRHLLTLTAYLNIADDKFKEQCISQLNKCNLSHFKRLVFELRIKYSIINIFCLGLRYLISKF